MNLATLLHFSSRCLRHAALASLALAMASPWAADWPSQTLRLVVGFPAGSSPDLTARALAEPLSKALGQNVVIENKVGAGGNIAADFVAKSTDGHTLGLMINGNMTIARILNPKVPYDPLTDLTPVSLIGKAPLVLSVPANAPGQNPAEWLSYAQKAGDKLSYASPGVGTVAHLGMELLKAKAGLAAVHVPYAGNPQIINAMIGGQVQLALLPPAMAAVQVRGGKLRHIGSTSSGRSRLPPPPMMYSATWRISTTSECSWSRITRSTACMSAAISFWSWSRATGGEKSGMITTSRASSAAPDTLSAPSWQPSC